MLYQILERIAGSRLMFFAACVSYAGALLFCLAEYASVEWVEYGYSYGDISIIDGLVIVVGLGAWSVVAPKSIVSASSMILTLILIAVCIPGLVVLVGLERPADDAYRGLVLWLVVSFAVSCSLVRALAPQGNPGPRRASSLFVPVLVALWMTCLVVLIAEYHSIMSIVSLDAIYDQREAGLATSRWMGYAQTYFGYVLSPALLAIGIVRRKSWLIALGFVGGLVLYSITAEKNAFAFPFVIVAFGYLLSGRRPCSRSVALLMLALASILYVAVFLNQDSLVAAFIAWYLGVRSLLTPGLFIAQYSDFFSTHGYTYLSHVTGLSYLIPPPSNLPGDRWPSLGHIVGEQHIGKIDLNANANFVASDGVASFGDFGIVIAFVLLSSALALLDRASRGVDRRFMILIALPIGLTLTNVSLFTVMLSFGGLFWLVAMPLFFRSTGPTNRWQKCPS